MRLKRWIFHKRRNQTRTRVESGEHEKRYHALRRLVIYQITRLCIALYYEEEFTDLNEFAPLISNRIVGSVLLAIEMVMVIPTLGLMQCNMEPTTLFQHLQPLNAQPQPFSIILAYVTKATSLQPVTASRLKFPTPISKRLRLSRHSAVTISTTQHRCSIKITCGEHGDAIWSRERNRHCGWCKTPKEA